MYNLNLERTYLIWERDKFVVRQRDDLCVGYVGLKYDACYSFVPKDGTQIDHFFCVLYKDFVPGSFPLAKVLLRSLSGRYCSSAVCKWHRPGLLVYRYLSMVMS